MKGYLIALLVVLATCLFSVASADKCKDLGLTDCSTCIAVSGCAFCKKSKECFEYEFYHIQTPCAKSDVQYKTCVGECDQELVSRLTSA